MLPHSEKLKQRVAKLKGDTPGLGMAVRTASYAHDVEGASLNDVLAAEANLAEHLKEIERLENISLPMALEKETEQEAAAASAEEKERAAAKVLADKANHRGAQTLTGTINRVLATVPGFFDEIAKATDEALRSAESYLAKIPDNIPEGDSHHLNLKGDIRQHVADLLAAAFAKYGIELPRGEVREQAPATWRKERKSGLDDFAHRVLVLGQRYAEPAPPKYRCANVRLDRYRPAGHRVVRGDPRAGPSWRADPVTGEVREPTRDEIGSDLRIGPPLGRYWEEAFGTPGVSVPGRYNRYVDADGRVVAQFLENSPVCIPDRAAEQSWIAAGQPDLQPGAPGFVEPAAETRHHVAAFAKPAVEQHVLLEADPAVLGPETIVVDGGRAAAEAWLASRNGGKPAPLEPPTTQQPGGEGVVATPAATADQTEY